VTIIVGLVSNEGIALASDSQAEVAKGVRIKRSNYNKIHSIDVNEGVRAVVCGAGQVAFINKGLEFVRTECKKQRIELNEMFIETVENAMIQLTKKYLVDRVKELGLEDIVSPKGSRRHKAISFPAFPHLDLGLLFAAVDKSGQYTLFEMNEDGVALAEERYSVIGSGSAYAEYILQRLYTKEMQLEEAMDTAAYTIEEVKKVDPTCGGSVQLASVTKEHGVKISTPDELSDRMSKLAIRDELLAKIWRALLLGKKQPSDVEDFLSR